MNAEFNRIGLENPLIVGSKMQLHKVVRDREMGRYEVLAGIGEVRVCVGHIIDKSGKFSPAYATIVY